MDTDKPLHAQVAEVLGWRDVQHHVLLGWGGKSPNPGPGEHPEQMRTLPCYDTNWSATGPLIEQLKIGIVRGDKGWLAFADSEGYGYVEQGAVDVPANPSAWGATPLVAVCALILELSGKP